MLKLSTHMAGAGALLASAFIYATFGLLIRATSTMFGTNAQVAIRFALAALVIVLFSVVAKKTFALRSSEWKRVLSLGVVFAVLVILFTISVNETKIANSVFLLYAGSIISSLIFGTIFLKEKLSSAKLVAIAVAFVGLAMYADTFLGLSLGIVTAFAAGLFEGVGNGIRKMLKGVDRRLVVLYSYAVGALIAFFAALFTGEQWILEVSLWPIVATVIFVALMIGISNLLLYGFQHFDVNVGTIILSCELIFATLLAFLFYQETPTPSELFGGLFIFIASILTVVDVPALLRRSKI